MTTVVDSNVLIALWDADSTLNQSAQRALDAALENGALIVPAPVFSELIALPGRAEAFLDRFFLDSGITVDWHLRETVWRKAGSAFQTYAKRRRTQNSGAPRRILADFLIGAYAAHHSARLLTLDHGLYRAAFPGLVLLSV